MSSIGSSYIGPVFEPPPPNVPSPTPLHHIIRSSFASFAPLEGAAAESLSNDDVVAAHHPMCAVTPLATQLFRSDLDRDEEAFEGSSREASVTPRVAPLGSDFSCSAQPQQMSQHVSAWIMVPQQRSSLSLLALNNVSSSNNISNSNAQQPAAAGVVVNWHTAHLTDECEDYFYADDLLPTRDSDGALLRAGGAFATRMGEGGAQPSTPSFSAQPTITSPTIMLAQPLAMFSSLNDYSRPLTPLLRPSSAPQSLRSLHAVPSTTMNRLGEPVRLPATDSCPCPSVSSASADSVRRDCIDNSIFHFHSHNINSHSVRAQHNTPPEYTNGRISMEERGNSIEFFASQLSFCDVMARAGNLNADKPFSPPDDACPYAPRSHHHGVEALLPLLLPSFPANGGVTLSPLPPTPTPPPPPLLLRPRVLLRCGPHPLSRAATDGGPTATARRGFHSLAIGGVSDSATNSSRSSGAQ